LNDSVRVSAEAHECELPFAALETIQGRVEDALDLPAVSGGKLAVQPLVFNRIMDIVPVGGWQLAQQADDGLMILVTGVRDGLADEALIEKLSRSLDQEGVHVPYIKVQHVTAIPKTETGKAPLIKAYRPSQAEG
jgi:phenylacetate-coenzyme A ligase PaaK-like adenylate-forming protein